MILVRKAFIAVLIAFLANTISGHSGDYYFVLDQLAECFYVISLIFVSRFLYYKFKENWTLYFKAFTQGHLILSAGELLQEILKQNTKPQLADYVNWPCVVIGIFVFIYSTRKRESINNRHN